MPTEKEVSIIEKSVMYDLRLIVKQSEKENYTREELLDLIDTIVMSKNQEG